MCQATRRQHKTKRITLACERAKGAQLMARKTSQGNGLVRRFDSACVHSKRRTFAAWKTKAIRPDWRLTLSTKLKARELSLPVDGNCELSEKYSPHLTAISKLIPPTTVTALKSVGDLAQNA